QSGELDRLYSELGAWKAVALHLGVHESNIRRARAKARDIEKTDERDFLDEIIEERGLDPVTLKATGHKTDFEDEEPTLPEIPLPAMPPGHLVKGASTLVRPDGSVAAQWIKTRQADVDRHEAMLEALSGLADQWRGLHDPTPAPANSNADLLAVYMMGDPHIGLYAWAEETGNSFDLEIAERTLVNAADRLVSVAPAARQALVVNVGDFYRSDNSFNRTARSGHALDVDTRW